MSRPLVVIDELDAEGAVVSMTAQQAARLGPAGLVDVRPLGDGQWQLVPQGTVGAVSVDDLQVQVTPKGGVGVAHLLFLLGYARDPGFRPEDVGGGSRDELWPALAESLARQTERALAHGVLQGYRSVDDSLRTVRGRIRISDQVARRPGLLLPLEVSYDEFTIDTAENRILRSALRRMLQVPRLGTDARRRLHHLDRRLDGVRVLVRGERPPRWTPTRVNQRYQAALRLAELVLAHTSVEAAGSGPPVASFVVSMWSVFEDFVTTALTEALRQQPGRTHRQFATCLDEPREGFGRGDLRMAVDVVHSDEFGRPLVVYDAKYKVAAAGAVNAHADHYQMLAYCTALKVPTAWLVYAGSHDGHTAAVARKIRHTDVTVSAFPLDLSAAPEQLLDQVADLARVSLGSAA